MNYCFLVFGHRNLTKHIKQTAVINILKTCILNFRIFVKVDFQKYNRPSQFLKSYLYCINGDLETV